MVKKKVKLRVNNKLKGAFGSSDFTKDNKPTGKIEVNLKKHYKKGKLDKAELASTIKHEMMHVKNPKMTEKEVYKRTAKTKISPAEQSKLIAKLRMSKLNQKSGAIKRKFKMGAGETKPGDFISKMNESKKSITNLTKPLSRGNVALMGLI